jgi:hypothetical protein
MNERVAAAVAPHKNAGAIATALPTERQRQDYRVDAVECQEIATSRPDLLDSQYEDLARQWLVLAEQAEWNSSRQYLRP